MGTEILEKSAAAEIQIQKQIQCAVTDCDCEDIHVECLCGLKFCQEHATTFVENCKTCDYAQFIDQGDHS